MDINIKIYSRRYLSISHISAASLFAAKSLELEKLVIAGTPASEVSRREHTSYVISSIMLSAAFLEATINELFSDCAEEHASKQIESIVSKDLMARLWKQGIPRTAAYSILDKYDIALVLNNKPPIQQDRNPYQDVKLLTELRNAFIHYEPETILTHATPLPDSAKPHKFEKKFRGKFLLNPLTGAGNAFYPNKLLGHGCANWAVKAAVAYTDVFFFTLGLTPTYEHVRASL